MSFNSFAYAIFLPIVFAVYWILPFKFRWIAILLASYYFYASWNAKYLVLIIAITAISYFCALLIEKPKFSARQKKLFAFIAVFASLSILFVFKYFNFSFSLLSRICNLFSINLHPITLKFLLPVGISFYTFQALSYVIDVYKGKICAEKHFGKYAAFISFFPQLVAGPIERSENLLTQIKAEHKFDYEQATYGLKLMAWGFFKKIVIADTFAQYVDKVFNTLTNYQGIVLVIIIFMFAMQIYCDFSGYSDIAIGTAKLFGINLMTNFKSPYFSSSIKEFWSRWHISLSTWFKDYVYIPLGGNRCSKLRQAFNLLVTFLISGLWHGAALHFVAWGVLHGILQIAENFLFAFKKVKFTLFKKFFRTTITFCLVCIAWIFFRAESLKRAIYVLKNMFLGIFSPVEYVRGIVMLPVERFAIFLPLLILFIYDFFALKKDPILQISKLPLILRWTIYFVFTFFLFVFVLFTMEKPQTQFVYFQF